MIVEKFEPGDLVCLKNNTKLILVVLNLNKGDDITVLWPDGVIEKTLPKIAFTKCKLVEYQVTINL